MLYQGYYKVFKSLTLSKKRNATNLAVFIFSISLIAQKLLGGLFIRHVTDRLWVVIQAEQCLFNA